MEGLDASSIVPLYKQLKDLILKEIKEGKLKTNQKIPTEQELSEKYQISRMTVRKALAQLVDEEVLAKKQGKGTFVQEPKIVEDLDNANSFTNLCKRNGKIPGGKTLKFVLEEPSENLYFPGHLKDILTENLDDSSLYQILQEKYGLRDKDFIMEIEVSECNNYEASVLDIKNNSPLLLVRELIYDQYNHPLHRTKSLLRGDKIKYITSRLNTSEG